MINTWTMRKGQCLKKNATEDGSQYLNIVAAAVPTNGGFTPYYIPTDNTGIPLQDPTLAGPGGNPTAVEPTTQEPPTTNPETPTVQPQEPTTTTPPQPAEDPVKSGLGYTDPAIEMDYYNIGCSNLNYIINYINNKLDSISSSGPAKSVDIRNYYQNKLQQAQAAYSSLKCDVPDVVDINNPTTVTNPGATTPVPDPGTTNQPAATNEPAPVTNDQPSTDTTTTTTDSKTPTAAATVPGTIISAPGAGAGGGGGGGGGGSENSPQAKKTTKRNWWLLAACIVAYGVAIYQGRKETL